MIKRLAILSLLGLCAALCASLVLDTMLPARSAPAVPTDWITQDALSTGGTDSVMRLTTDGTDIVGVGILGGPTPGSIVSSTHENMLLFRLNAHTGAVISTAVFAPSFLSPTFRDFASPLSIVAANNAFYVAGTLMEQLTALSPRAAFLVKLDATFAVQTFTLWTTPTAWISGFDLDADAGGNIYVAGSANVNVQGENLGGFRGWMEKLDANLNRQCGGAFGTGAGSLFSRTTIVPPGSVGTPVSPLLATDGGAVTAGAIRPLAVLWDSADCTLQKSYILEGMGNSDALTAVWSPNGMLYVSLQTIDLSSAGPNASKWGLAIISPTGTITPTVIDYSAQGTVQMADLHVVGKDPEGFRLLAAGERNVLTPSAQFPYWAALDREGKLLSSQSYGQSGRSFFNTLLISGENIVNGSILTAFAAGATDQNLNASSGVLSAARMGGMDGFVERISLDIRSKVYLPLSVR